VYKGVHRSTKQIYAIKVLNLDTSEDDVRDVQQEIQFLSHLKQVPNVTHYYGSYLNGTKLWIIMDYCAGGSLRTLLKPGRLEEKYIGVVVREVLIALQYIHKQNVIHRDIKAANVLITNEGKVQLCDFGVAAQLTATNVRRNTMAGTPYWMAPEVIMEGTSYDVKADIWSLGITIYEIATGNPPYCDKEAMRAMQLITKSKPPRLDGKQYSLLLKEIIALCLDENPQERLNAEELLKSKFIKFHKSSSTILLKELISRYLLWREKKSSRESMLMNVEDDFEEQEIEVKWDFDSLSSNEYILENDINVDNINLNSETPENFETADYDDGVDQFMTGYKAYDTAANGTLNYTNNSHINHTSNVTFKNNTVTNIGSTLKNDGNMNRKGAPKSLLQLFEERSEDEEEDSPDHNDERLNTSQFELPKISSAVALHNLSNSSAGISTPVISTPIKEIEIPNFDDIETLPTVTSHRQQQHHHQQSQQQQQQLQHQQNQQLQHQQHQGEARSRANTLLQSQAPAGMDTKKSMDPGLQRRPTLTNMSMSQTQQPVSSVSASSTFPPSVPVPSLPVTGSQSNVTRFTPSPKREQSNINPSPSQLTISTTSPVKNNSNASMKAIQSPSNISPLLQPLNGLNSSNTSQQSSQYPPAFNNVNNSSIKPSQTAPQIKRNYQNLRLQMPTPTTNFPKLLDMPSDVSSHEPNNPDQDENLNQFGVNVSNIPMAMTPLTEKAPNSAFPGSSSSTSMHTSSIPKRKATLSGAIPASLQQQSLTPSQQPSSSQHPSQQQFSFLSNRETSSLSSQSSHDGIHPTTTFNTSVDHSRIFGMPPSLDTSLFIDSENAKEKLLTEISGLFNGLNGLLGGLEEKLVDFS
jgi:protein-serine/threonine kinase